jgi:hypothetical protein
VTSEDAPAAMNLYETYKGAQSTSFEWLVLNGNLPNILWVQIFEKAILDWYECSGRLM